MRSTGNTFIMIKRNKTYKERELTGSNRLGRWLVEVRRSGGCRTSPTAAQGGGWWQCDVVVAAGRRRPQLREVVLEVADSSTFGRRPPGTPMYRYTTNKHQKLQRQLGAIYVSKQS
jgi:hypothetical protein